jgi:predicted aspartyl protease
VVGSFDTSGSPTIDIDVLVWNTGVSRTITATLDTGFTGFLMLPMMAAFPVGLILHSTIDITLADSSTHRSIPSANAISAAEAVADIRELRKGVRLDGLNIKDLIEEGRRF